MDVGTTLRTARERLGLSQGALAARTKISPALLDAIERNAFDRLPRGIIVRGFLRAYAQEVGLDPEETVQQYLKEAASPAAAGSPPRGVSGAGRPAPELDAPNPGRALGGYLILAVLVVTGFVYIANRTADTPPLLADRPDGTDELVAEPVEATTGSPAGPPEAVASEDARPLADDSLLRVEIAPAGPCWVEVRADGQLRIYRLMQAGEREVLDVRDVISIRVGDPAMFAYTINGRPGRPLGRPGIPTTATLTPGTWESFLAGASS